MAETMSNLERYLRESQGINFCARRDMAADEDADIAPRR